MTMKKLMVLLSVSFLLPSVADAWEGEYELDNGAKVTRKPDGFQIQKGGLNLNAGGLHLSKGSNTQGIIPSSDVDLNMDMDSAQLRQQLSKLGNITKSTVNPPETPAAAPLAAQKSVPVAARKSAPVARKRSAPVAKKKSAPVVKKNSSRVAKNQARRQALLNRRQARLAAKK